MTLGHLEPNSNFLTVNPRFFDKVLKIRSRLVKIKKRQMINGKKPGPGFSYLPNPYLIEKPAAIKAIPIPTRPVITSGDFMSAPFSGIKESSNPLAK